MPDPHRIRSELQILLSLPQFSSIFFHRNQFAKPGSLPDTAETIAAQTANYLWEKKPLLDPVEVVVLRGPLELYRAYDGGVRKGSAGTLGRSWFERSVAETIWQGTAKYSGEDRRKWYMEFLRTANFVLPEWNDMLQIAYMSVPSGASVVVARGRGNWRAMRTPPGKTRPGGAPRHRERARRNDGRRNDADPRDGAMHCAPVQRHVGQSDFEEFAALAFSVSDSVTLSLACGE